MYIVLFLHQTTTCYSFVTKTLELYIVLFLHQTTTIQDGSFFLPSCISYYSYIKPQQYKTCVDEVHVVYRTIPTSNHNHSCEYSVLAKLYIVLFLHQTTTTRHKKEKKRALYIVLFLHQATTVELDSLNVLLLYIVLFLHQTTTLGALNLGKAALYIVLFLHQTTTILRISQQLKKLYIVLFLHQTTTSEPYTWITALLYIVLFLHQTTTVRLTWFAFLRCISYYSYIKPQHSKKLEELTDRCISYYSYIKPQHDVVVINGAYVVYRTIPTSNHNTDEPYKAYFMLYIVLFLHQTTTQQGHQPFSKGCISYYSYIKPQQQMKHQT